MVPVWGRGFGYKTSAMHPERVALPLVEKQKVILNVTYYFIVNGIEIRIQRKIKLLYQPLR